MRDGWTETTLGDIAAVIGGGTPKTSVPEYWGGDIPWITPTEVAAQDGTVVCTTDRSITEEGLKKSGAKLLPVGAVLLTSRATIGAVALAGVPMATNQGFASMIAGPDVLPGFLMYWCQHHKNDFIVRAGGNTFLEVSKGKVKDVPITLPPLPVQLRIVDLIETIDTALVTAIRQRQEADSCLQALRAQEFDGRAWPEVSLGDMVKIDSRLVDPLLPEFAELPHVGVEAIRSGAGVIGQVSTAAEDGVISGKYLFRPGQVVYSKIRPNLRKAFLPDSHGLCSADAYPLTPLHGAEPAYLLELLLSDRFSEQATARSGRTKMPKINRADLLSMQVPCPPLKEQQRIGAIGQAFREQIRGVSVYASALESLRAALLSDLLSGEHEIPESYDELLDRVV